MSHIWMRNVTHTHESRHTYRWDMAHMWISRVAQKWVTSHMLTRMLLWIPDRFSTQQWGISCATVFFENSEKKHCELWKIWFLLPADPIHFQMYIFTNLHIYIFTYLHIHRLFWNDSDSLLGVMHVPWSSHQSHTECLKSFW